MNPVDNRPQKALSEMVFISEIVLHSKIAELAAKRLSEIKDNFDQIEVWSSIQSILVATGNVSKILWPQKKKYAIRGKRLRELFKVDDNNILSDRSFRNHFEHYDERIEDWFKKQSSAVYSDLAVDPFKSFGNFPTNHHRAYDPLKQTVTFRGESFDLAGVLKELKEIRIKCCHFVLT